MQPIYIIVAIERQLNNNLDGISQISKKIPTDLYYTNEDNAKDAVQKLREAVAGICFEVMSLKRAS
jgi:hypothetical protein